MNEQSTGQEWAILMADDDEAESKAIGYMTGFELSSEFGTIDSSSFEDPEWEELLPGQGSWSISSDTLTVPDDAGQKVVRAAHFSRAKKYFTITKASAKENDITFEGYGYVTSLSLSAQLNEVVSGSFEMSGTGKLKEGKIPGNGNGT